MQTQPGILLVKYVMKGFELDSLLKENYPLIYRQLFGIVNSNTIPNGIYNMKMLQKKLWPFIIILGHGTSVDIL